MPINLPNGNDVEEIVLPNGANASEVYGPNGNLVWEGTAIPDSVVYHYLFDEGTGSTAADSGSFENDFTLTGGGWVTDSRFAEGVGWSSDGIDDYAIADSNISGEIGDEGTFQVEIVTIDTSISDGAPALFVHLDSNGDTVVGLNFRSNDAIRIRTHEGDYNDNFTPSDGEFYNFFVRWDSGTIELVETETDHTDSESYSGSISFDPNGDFRLSRSHRDDDSVEADWGRVTVYDEWLSDSRIDEES